MIRRKIINKKYIEFIRKLPCCKSGKCPAQVHHVMPTGRMQMENDLFTVPLGARFHVPSEGHVSYQELQKMLKYPIIEYILFYNNLYIMYLEGYYDLERDKSTSFMTLRRLWNGLESIGG